MFNIEEDRNPEEQLDELLVEEAEPAKPLDSWVELLLKAVDAMCVGRYADVRAMNEILNELDSIEMPWIHLVHSELVRVADRVHR